MNKVEGNLILSIIDKSSRLQVFCRKGVLRNFTKFTRKHLYQSLFFNNVAGLRPATLLKIRLCPSCFPVNFVKFLRKPFFTEHLRTTASVRSIECEDCLIKNISGEKFVGVKFKSKI